MEPFYLMPGQERCVSRSVEEAERLCEDWLVGQDRCYIN